MSDNARTKSIATEPAPLTGDVLPVETYADRLMDDLFTDFDQSLKSGSSLPTEPPPSDYVSLKSLSIPAISLPTIVKLPQPAMDDDTKTVETKAVRTDEKSSDSNQWLDKWLIGAACGSLLIMLALWLGTRTQTQQQAQTTPLPNPATSVAPNPMSESDTEFIKYMLRSLERIEKQPTQTGTAAQGNAAPAQPAQNVINLPPIPLSLNIADANSLAQALNRLAGALEKAGVQTAATPTNKAPAQPQANQSTAKPAGTASPASPKATPTAKASPAAATTQPAVAAADSSVAIAIPGAPAPPAVATPRPKPTQEPAAETSTQPSAPAQTPQSSSETPAQPAPETTQSTLPQLTPQPTGDVHTLVGILELGDRSAALFEVNGVARRVNEGESIGGSGWTLVEVANQEAVIRRNGEVRSIYVGQKF